MAATAGVAGGEVNGVGDDVLLQAAGEVGKMKCQDDPGLDMLHTWCESYIPWALKIPPAAPGNYPLPSTVTRKAAGKVRRCRWLGTVRGPGSGVEAAVVVSHPVRLVSGACRGKE